jgi:transposase
MYREPPVPPELWEQVPPHVQATLWVVIDGYERRVSALEAEVRELKEQVGRSSQNSSPPPSADRPHVKRKPPRAPSGRTRGGQPGHPVHQRALLPLEEVDEVVVRKPTHCRRGGEALGGREGPRCGIK